MECAHASDPGHQCCGKHEHGRSGPTTAAADLLRIEGHCSCGNGCERALDADPPDHATR